MENLLKDIKRYYELVFENDIHYSMFVECRTTQEFEKIKV